MVVYEIRAPEWPEKSALIRDNGKNKPCRFCQLAETPLVETNLWKIIEAKYPYSPEHCMLIPKEHHPALHKMDRYEFNSILDAIDILSSKHKELTAICNFGVTAGQTIKHFHIHLINSNIAALPFTKLKYVNLDIADPLSYPILIESGYLKLQNTDEYITHLSKKSDVYDWMCATFTTAFEGFFNLIQKRQHRYVNEYGYPYEKLEKIAWLYKATAEDLNNIMFLFENKIVKGFGINWSISKEDEHFSIKIMPRACITPNTIPQIRLAALEVFHKTLLYRNGLSEEELKEWKDRQNEFNSKIKEALNSREF